MRRCGLDGDRRTAIYYQGEQTTTRVQANISFMRLLRATLALSFLLVFDLARTGSAQTPLPLGLNNNYMVTGDYVVGGMDQNRSFTIAAVMTKSTAAVWSAGEMTENP